MSNTINSLIEDPDALLALDPEELGAVLLSDLDSSEQSSCHMPNFMNTIRGAHLYSSSSDRRESILRAFSEAWGWLESEGLLAQCPGQDHGFLFITRRGRQALKVGAHSYLKGKLLPRHQLHQELLRKLLLRSFAPSTTLLSSKPSKKLRSPSERPGTTRPTQSVRT
jgi:hypothetical protein